VSNRRHVYADPQGAAQACAQDITAILDEARQARGIAALAVSGGSTPRLMFQALIACGWSWDRVHLFWVDERSVPPSDPQSNFRLARECLIDAAKIPAAQIHRVFAEEPPREAAERYQQELRAFFSLPAGELPQFDVIQLGMGPDAHTASLFPGEPMIADREGLVSAIWVEKFATWRITLLPGVLLAARHTLFLVAGQDKAQAVRSVFEAPYDALKYPAQLPAVHARDVTWFLDQPAASLLTGA
jgi:6-phosphogluconolactonase